MRSPPCLRAFVPSCLLLGSCLLLAGCVERLESITVHHDGTVDMRVSFEADSFDELYLGDAIPSLDRGWLVADWTEVDEEGAETFHLSAEQSFAPDEPLPGDYAALKHPYGDQVLRFPTEVVMEPRDDGLYFHFRRVYEPRPWAYLEQPIQELRKHLEKLIGDRELGDLPPGEQQSIIQTVARGELLKQTSFARSAFLEVGAQTPQDVWLSVHAALQPLADDIDAESLVALLLDEENPEAQAALEDEAQALRDRALDVAMSVLRESGSWSQTLVNRFAHQFDQHRELHAITEELGDDRFTVTVHMPGTIVGHNGDTSEGDSVTWKFSGAGMRDRKVELMISSKLDW